MDSDAFRELARLDDYQMLAAATNQLEADLPEGIDPEQTLKRLVPLLGMAGEVGSLLVEFKKHIRDGAAHRLFPDHIGEELGDILWYLASTATNFDHKLSDLAAANLQKTRRRWPARGEQCPPYTLFDDDCAPHEQLPRQFVAEIWDVEDDDGFWHAEITIDGEPAGDHLRDNAEREDYYRFHDVFHLAHAAMLGWSPVVRGKLLHPRRKRSHQRIDEVQDGGRAIVIDEAIVAYVWGYALNHGFLEGVTTVDFQILKTIDQLTAGLEVSARQLYEWEEAILAGYRIFRGVKQAGRGTIEVDLLNRSVALVA
jgi:NTP pyrophosphatase (non-canonical NTP hydrolase)